MSAAVGLWITGKPAGAVLGCDAGQAAVNGKIKPLSGVPKLTKTDVQWKSDTTHGKKHVPDVVNPGGTGEFLYCGNGLFTFPFEMTAAYRLEGPKVGSQVTSFLVKLRFAIPFQGGNTATCEMSQDFGPKVVNPYFCNMNLLGHNGGRYALMPEVTVEKRKQQVVNDSFEQARLLTQYCAGGDLSQCEFDPSQRINGKGPTQQVSDAAVGRCDLDLNVAKTWAQTVATTYTIGETYNVTLSTLNFVVSAGLTLNYSVSYTESLTKSDTYSWNVTRGKTQALFRSANLITVSGKFVLGGSGPTEYVIPNAIFTFADPSGLGTLTVQDVGTVPCP